MFKCESQGNNTQSQVDYSLKPARASFELSADYKIQANTGVTLLKCRITTTGLIGMSMHLQRH